VIKLEELLKRWTLEAEEDAYDFEADYFSINEIIPKFVLNKRPNKLSPNPVSHANARLVSILLNKLIEFYPELIVKNNNLIYR